MAPRTSPSLLGLGVKGFSWIPLGWFWEGRLLRHPDGRWVLQSTPDLRVVLEVYLGNRYGKCVSTGASSSSPHSRTVILAFPFMVVYCGSDRAELGQALSLTRLQSGISDPSSLGLRLGFPRHPAISPLACPAHLAKNSFWLSPLYPPVSDQAPPPSC